MYDEIFFAAIGMAALTIIILVPIMLIVIIKDKEEQTSNNSEQQNQLLNKNKYIPNRNYKSKRILTNNEYYFYKALLAITEELDFCILAKVRLADLLEIINYKNNSEYYSLFGKIKAKHIDFALADKQTLEIKLIIELDDSSHKSRKAAQSDKFKNEVLQNAGYKILRVSGSGNLKKKIQSLIAQTV